MSPLRRALFANVLFSATTGSVAAAAPDWVAGWLGTVPAGEIQLVGAQLLVFAATVAWFARKARPHALAVLLISGADCLWVLGTIPVLLLWPQIFSTVGAVAMVAIALCVGALATAQLTGLAGQYRHPRGSEHTHRVCLQLHANAPVDAMWRVIGDLGTIADHSDGLKESGLIVGDAPGVGAVRRCVDLRGQAWTEQCTAYEPGHSLTLRFNADAPGFPFPFAAMIGGWTVEPATDGTCVRVWWDLTPKYGALGGLVVAVMAATLAPSMTRLVRTMAAHATGEPASAPAAVRRAIAC